MRRNGWIVTMLLLGALAATVGAGRCLRLPAFTQSVWDRWAEVGPAGVVQTVRLESGTLAAVGIGLGCDGGGCAAALTLTDAEGHVLARATVHGSELEDVACPIRRPYRWVRLEVDAKSDVRLIAVQVMPLPGSEGRLLVRAAEQDVYLYGEANGIEGAADLSFQLFDEVAGFKGFGRLIDRVAGMWPGILGWRGTHAGLVGLVAALGAGFLAFAAAYGLGAPGRPGHNSE